MVLVAPSPPRVLRPWRGLGSESPACFQLFFFFFFPFFIVGFPCLQTPLYALLPGLLTRLKRGHLHCHLCSCTGTEGGTCSGGPQPGPRVCPTEASPVPSRARQGSSAGADPAVVHGAWPAGAHGCHLRHRGAERSPAVCMLGGRDRILPTSALIPCCGSDSPCLLTCPLSGNFAASFSSCWAERSVSPVLPLSPAPSPTPRMQSPRSWLLLLLLRWLPAGREPWWWARAGHTVFAQCSGPGSALMF